MDGPSKMSVSNLEYEEEKWNWLHDLIAQVDSAKMDAHLFVSMKLYS